MDKLKPPAYDYPGRGYALWGEEIHVPRGAPEEGIQSICEKIDETLNRLEQQADAMARQLARNGGDSGRV